MSDSAALVPPRLLLGAIVLFWGWQCELYVQAAVMALCLEAAPLLGVRFSLTAREYGRFSDLCVVLLLGQGLYLYLTPDRSAPLLVVGQWLPMTFFPLALAEAFSEKRRITLAAFFSSLRRKRDLARTSPLTFSFSPLYAFAALLAAGCANTRSPLFYPIMGGLAAWYLFSRRPGRYSLAVWFSVIIPVLLCGYFGQQGIHEVQQAVRGWARQDPFKRSTSIGSIGRVKLSRRIVLRVRTQHPIHKPLLLREASYNFFDGQNWHAVNAEFTQLAAAPYGNNATWRLLDYAHTGNAPDTTQLTKSITVFQPFTWRGGLLYLPLGAQRLDKLPVGELAQNGLGAVMVEQPPGLAGYQARYDPARSLDAPPGIVDRVVLPQDKKRLARLAEDLELDKYAPDARIRRILDYFRGGTYRYSLVLEREHPELSPLMEFLEHTHAGHCEYYALAAVFLLREAGIPARYATGYSVQEFSQSESLYVARELHAHAWALAWTGGAWRDVDATPPIWSALDSGDQTLWGRLGDFRQRLAFAFARWRWLGQDAQTRRIMLWTVGPLLAFLLYRLARHLRLRRSRPSPANVADAFAPVVRRLTRQGFVRRLSEPLCRYLERSGASELLPAVRIYYRQRFDPLGVSDAEHREMERSIRSWLDK